MSTRKSLWRDELNTQTYTLQESYADILLGHDHMEGNTAPLFYLQQKIWCDLFHFRTPPEWLKSQWDHTDPYADIFLRIPSVFWMSSFFLLLLVYFSVRFNLGVGLLALATGLSSPMLWLYWAEARPYSLWVFLTGLQMVLFMEMLRAKRSGNGPWLALSLVHMLLSLTTAILSVFQITIVCGVLAFKERRWLMCFPALIIPWLIALIYKTHGAWNEAVFLLTPVQMLLSVLAPSQIGILILYAAALRMFVLQKRKLLPALIEPKEIETAAPFFACLALIAAAVFAGLVLLYQHAAGRGQYIVPRHFIFLQAITILGVSYTAGLLWHGLKPWGMKVAALTAMSAFWLWGMDSAWPKICYLWAHNPYA